VDAADGVVAIRNVGDTTTDGQKITLTYTAADIQTHTVKITSSQDAAGFDLTVTEVDADGVAHPDTGIFEGTFTTAASTTSTLSRINTVAGGKVTVTYDDDGTNRVAEAIVEVTEPVVTLSSPADGTATDQTNVELAARITDSDSGVDEDSIMFTVNRLTPLGTVGAVVDVTAVETTAISGGFLAEIRITGIVGGEIPMQWTVTAADVAGNTNTSDPIKIKIDTVPPRLAPGNVQAETGHHLDLDADPVLVDDPAKGKRTSVRLIFNEALDGLVAHGGSVDVSDFEVNDAVPAAVSWSSDLPESVFLTVAELPSPAARPKVEMVGIIRDTAGNEQRSVLTVTESADGISPTVTASVSPSSALDKEEVSIQITVDETLLTTPTVTITDGKNATTSIRSPAPPAGDCTVCLARVRVDPLNANRFTTTFDAPGTSTAFSIHVSAKDPAGNESTIGVKGVDAVASDDVIKFEIDSTIVAPVLNFPGKNLPVDLVDVFTQNPFVDLDFAAEGEEYSGDSHAKIEITAITLNGDDVSGAATLSREADGQFVLALRGLAQQAHELKLTATDDAGNELLDHTVAFTVRERADFAVDLVPGWNLISFPGEPSDAAINVVIPAGTAADPATINQVLTYDPAEAGAWLVAVRGDDGLLGGTLTTMSATRAYWVHSTSFKDLSVQIPLLQGGSAQLLPTINLVVGWNLVGIIDVSGEKVAGDRISSIATYMKGVTAPSTVYRYLAREDRFESLANNAIGEDDAGAPLGAIVGRGFWMYMGSAGILVP
jgi:hypothetical protein